MTITKRLCEEPGIKHPEHSGVLQFMSTDFLVKTGDPDKHTLALQVKTSDDLEDPRTVEKLEIERLYWTLKEIPWYVITEKEIPKQVFRNIDWLYSLQAQDYSLAEEAEFFEFFSNHLEKNSHLTVIDLCKRLDTSYHLELGESLFQIRALLARRYFHFDIRIPYGKLVCGDLRSESLETVVGLQNVSS